MAMSLAPLIRRAMELHEKFGRAALTAGRRPWTRDEIMQGFVGDVGDLMKLTMARNGARPIAEVDRKLGHELADCLWSVLVLAELHGVDLEREFEQMVSTVSASLPSGE
jgi:NTP pyrophosphatase (non-canonical NTP hydrolase)